MQAARVRTLIYIKLPMGVIDKAELVFTLQQVITPTSEDSVATITKGVTPTPSGARDVVPGLGVDLDHLTRRQILRHLHHQPGTEGCRLGTRRGRTPLDTG
jgi:hypothetical protein